MTLQIFRAELQYMFRSNPKAALLILLLPLLFSLLFGLAYRENIVQRVPTVIYDQEQSPLSLALIRAIADSDRYAIKAQVNSSEALEDCLARGEAVTALIIPADFSRQIKLGQSSSLQLIISSPNVMFANAVLGSIQEIIQTFSAGISLKAVEGLGKMPAEAMGTAAAIKLNLRVLNNPTLAYSNFMLPGMGANGLQISLMIGLCYVIVREYGQLGRWRHAAAPQVLGGKLLACWLCSLLPYAGYLTINRWLFAVPCRGSWLELLLIGGAFTFAIINAAIFFSALARDTVSAVQLPMLYIMPAYLFSGYSWPALSMNAFSRGFSALLPISYAADPIRDLLLAGFTPKLWHNVLMLLCIGLVLFIAASLIFHYRRRTLLAGAREVHP